MATDGYRMWCPSTHDCDAINGGAMVGLDPDGTVTFEATFQCPDHYQNGIFGLTPPEFEWLLGGNVTNFLDIDLQYEDYATHPNQATLAITDAGNPNAPSSRFNVLPGAWNVIKVTITSSAFTAAINGVTVLSATNDDPADWDNTSVTTCLYVKPTFQEQLTGGLIIRGFYL